MNLLDDSLSADLARAGSLTPAMTERFLTLSRYAAGTGADGILFTCSAFGPCIDAVAAERAPMPVLKPNEAMIDEAVAEARRLAGPGRRPRIGLLATFQPTLETMPPEFPAEVTVVPHWPPARWRRSTAAMRPSTTGWRPRRPGRWPIATSSPWRSSAWPAPRRWWRRRPAARSSPPRTARCASCGGCSPPVDGGGGRSDPAADHGKGRRHVQDRCADPGLSGQVAVPWRPGLEHHRPAARAWPHHPDRCRLLRGAAGIRPPAQGRGCGAGAGHGCGPDPRPLGPFGELHAVPECRCLDRQGRDGLGHHRPRRLQPAAGAVCGGPGEAPEAASAGGQRSLPGKLQWGLHRPSLPRPHPGLHGLSPHRQRQSGGVQRRCGEEPGGAALARHRHDHGRRRQPRQPRPHLGAVEAGAGHAADPGARPDHAAGCGGAARNSSASAAPASPPGSARISR